MAEALRVSGDLVVAGAILGATSFSYPAGSIKNADVAADAALSASKLQGRIPVRVFQSGTAADETLFARLIEGATATIRRFKCGCITGSNGGSYVLLDLKKNGVSVLAGAVTLNAATGTTVVAGTITTASAVAGDVLTVVIDGVWFGSDYLAHGVWAQIELDEAYPA